jgi:hypothetical protein
VGGLSSQVGIATSRYSRSDYPYQAVIAFNQQGDADAEARRMNEMWHTSAYTVKPLTLFDI